MQILLGAALVLLILLGWIVGHPNAICCDCAINLQWGDLLCNGKVSYRDFCDLDPPLIGYLNMVPAGIALLLHAPLVLVFSLTVWIICVASKFAILQAFSTSTENSDKTLPAVVVLSAALFDLMMISFHGDLTFGQKEHLFVLFFTPYLVLRWLRWTKESKIALPSAALYGVLAAMAVCLKHYFIVIPASLELYWLLTTRKPRRLLDVENIAAFSFAATYALHFFLFDNLRNQYINRWVPLILKGYGYCSFPALQMLIISIVVKGYAELLVLAGLAAFVFRKRSALLIPLFIYSTASSAAYIWQGKSWSYQAIPLIFGIQLLASVLIESLASRLPAKRIALVNAAAVGLWSLLLFGFMACMYSIWEAPYAGKPNNELSNLIIEKTKIGDPILFLSTTPGDAYPKLVQLNRRAGSRYVYDYPIDMFAYLEKDSSPAAQDAILKSGGATLFTSDLLADINDRKPKLIFIRTVPQGRANVKVSDADFVNAHAELADEIRHHYHPLGIIGALAAYERRKD